MVKIVVSRENGRWVVDGETLPHQLRTERQIKQYLKAKTGEKVKVIWSGARPSYGY